MKIPRLFLFALLGLCFFETFAADYIIKIRSESKVLKSNYVEIKNENVYYTTNTDSIVKQFAVKNLYSIHFEENNQYLVKYEVLSFDTIVCSIDSISDFDVFYRNDEGRIANVSRQEVFCVDFNPKDVNLKLNSYQNAFLKIYSKSALFDPVLTLHDGSSQSLMKIYTLGKERLDFKLMSGGRELLTYVQTERIKAIHYKKPFVEKLTNKGDVYILSKKGILRKVLELKNINQDTISLKLDVNDKQLWLEQHKKGLKALCFYDFENPDKLMEKSFNVVTKDVKTRLVKLSFSTGIGYMIADVQEGISGAQEDYINELRLGLDFDANLTISLSEDYGLGVKYNLFKTSNSTSFGLEDNIRITFVGPSFTGRSKISGSNSIFYFSTSLGYLQEFNNAKALSRSYKISGNTLGLYLSTGVDIKVTNGVYINLQAAYLSGNISKLDVNGSTIDLDEKESLSRLDATLGLSFYF